MNDEARKVLEAIIPTSASEYVFPGRYDDKAYCQYFTYAQTGARKGGIAGFLQAPVHGLRHSFAPWLASSGQVSMYELQKLLTLFQPANDPALCPFAR